MSTPTRMDKATKEDLRAEIAELRRVGQGMANVCFNWACIKTAFKTTLDMADRDVMRNLFFDWKAIKRREPR